MSKMIEDMDLLAGICVEVNAELGVQRLVEVISKTMSWPDLVYALKRGHWHRLGGIVDIDHHRVADNIVAWAEHESEGDVDELIARYADCAYLVTRLAGTTHYLTVPSGESPEEFIQIEVEELQEVIERPLIEEDMIPDTIEEFIDPLEFTQLEPIPVGKPYYLFRRMTAIDSLLKEASAGNRSMARLCRFFNDWRQSSAFGGQHFCRHWVLALREYTDSDGEIRMTARPVSIDKGKSPESLFGDQLHGAELANAIHEYDRKLGYPFAWFFMLLSHQSDNHELAYAVLQDQNDTYDYLPAKDLKILRAWGERPYAV